MGVINRTNNETEKRVDLDWSFGPYGISSGETGALCMVPLSGVLVYGQMSVGYATGSSLNILLQVQRFTPNGVTFINCGSTFIASAASTSGTISLNIPATFLVMANDVIGYLSAGGSSMQISNVSGGFVMECIQDHKRYFGNYP